MSSSDSSEDDSFLASSLASSAAAPPAGAAAPAPDPMFEIKSETLTSFKAPAKRPGQNGSTSTLADFKMVAILSAVISTPSSLRINAAYVQANSDDMIRPI